MSIKLEMNFLPDVWITCDVCNGKRYTRECLEVHGEGEPSTMFLRCRLPRPLNSSKIIEKFTARWKHWTPSGWDTSDWVNQQPPSRAGKPNVKLASELRRMPNKHTVYILDEPTTGLSFSDVAKLINVLQQLRDKGHTMIIIEHHLDVVKSCDWVIDLGPEGGERGGQVIALVHQKMSRSKSSATGQFLAKMLNQ